MIARYNLAIFLVVVFLHKISCERQRLAFAPCTSYRKPQVSGLGKSKFLGAQSRFKALSKVKAVKRNGDSKLSMVFGSDGGFFGVGAPEVVIISLVGYFVLGPEELYKIVKEIGKLVTSFKTLSADATKNFEDSMENQLEISELRKAQRDLNDAFNFRRSINTEDETIFEDNKEIFNGEPKEPRRDPILDEDGNPKKKIRRRIKKKVAIQEDELPAAIEEEQLPAAIEEGQIPDLTMPELSKHDQDLAKEDVDTDSQEKLRQERIDRLQESSSMSWFEDSEQLPQEEVATTPTASTEESRFQAQLSGQWNDQVLANEDKLSPLSKIMDRLAILEDEKNAADLRLEEEFRLRGELEEKFYKEKRTLLEEAAAETQMDAYKNLDDSPLNISND